jgi:hypothetical protein
LHLFHAQYGKIGFIDEVMSVYRRHPGGLWWDARDRPSLIWEKFGYNYLLLLHQIMLMHGDSAENKKIIGNHIAGSYEAIASISSPTLASEVAAKAIRETPVETWEYIKHLLQQVEHYSKHDAYLQDVLDHEAKQRVKQERTINQLHEQTIRPLNEELSAIKSSKAWRLAGLVRGGRAKLTKGFRKSRK